jgi:large subunit ribosomal protein L10
MAISRVKKEELVSGMTTMVRDAGSVVFVKFQGLKVNDANELRKKLQAENVGLTVTKKTLLKRALEANNVAGELPALDGAVAIAYGKDLLSPAREVHAFYKTHKDELSIIGGVFEGKYMNAAEMSVIATIPSRETLIAQILMLIQSPIRGFAVAVSEIAKTKRNHKLT